MDPLQPGEEVEIAELTTGKLENDFFFCNVVPMCHQYIALIKKRGSCIPDSILFSVSQLLNVFVMLVISESDG